jgi:hypothetical protein
MNLSSPPYVLHATPSSFYFIRSFVIIFSENYRSISSSLCSFLHSHITSSLLDPKNLSQHPTLKHPPPMFLPQRERSSFTPIQNNLKNNNQITNYRGRAREREREREKEGDPCSEANSCSASPEIPLILRNPTIYKRLQNSPPLVTILNQMNPVHAYPLHFNIIPPSSPGDLSGFISSDFPISNQ